MATKLTTEVAGHRLTLTNLDKPLFPDGFTKGEVIYYLQHIESAILPQIVERCLTRVRFPNGTQAPAFYEKNIPSGSPAWVHTQLVETSEGTVTYPVATGIADLVWLGNLAAIEFHAPQWVISDATNGPGGLVLTGEQEPATRTLLIDLDPGDGVGIDTLAKAALITATQLAEFGLEGLVKSSGGKGLQLSFPLVPTPASETFEFAKALAQLLTRRYPKMFTSVISKQARAGLVYLDYAQNLAARNTVVAYSLRGNTKPRVATPLTWDEVGQIAAGNLVPDFGPNEALDRLQQVGDLWASPPSAGKLFSLDI